MEWEPVFILGVMGGTMLVSVVRGVIDLPARAAPRSGSNPRPGGPARPAVARTGEASSEIGDLKDRIATLEWLAAPAARAAAEKDRLRRGAA